MSVQQHVVLVTGSSSGFGRRIVETLAQQGHHVFASLRDINGKNAPHANVLRELAQRENVSLSVLELDVTDEVSVNQAVQAVIDQTGRVDVVVNNAGITGAGITEAYTLNQVKEHMEINFYGPLRVNRAVLPHMRREHNGLLIHMSSLSGGLLFPFSTLYSAGKMALEAFAEGYHYELAPLGIESVIIEPGLFATELIYNQQAPQDQERLGDYGSLNEIPVQMVKDIKDLNRSSHAQNPQVVADLVANLIAQPRGTRPLRTIIGPDPGLASLNKAKAQAQQAVIASSGLAETLAFKAHN